MKKQLFLTLNTFSATGGIEKVCRAAGKALFENAQERGEELSVYSIYDGTANAMEAYFPASIFHGFAGKRLAFVLQSLRKGKNCHTVILSHINLLAVGYLIKKIAPETRLILLAHGIEVWQPLSSFKRRMLKAVDLFLPVSQYTSNKLQTVLNIPSQKLQVLNNCLDPFLKRTFNKASVGLLKARYGIAENDMVLFTLTRIKFSEQYKGYDKVITALTQIKKAQPNIKYLIAGRYDAAEKARLDLLIKNKGLEDRVIFTGFVGDDDIAAHFNLADIYIMPSTGEGFGIVFIEALFYGIPVIAGNADGSVDALANGDFGLLVDPANEHEIVEAVNRIYSDKTVFAPVSEKVNKKFGFDQYKTSWHKVVYGQQARNANLLPAERAAENIHLTS